LEGDITFTNHHLTMDKALTRTKTHTTNENSKQWNIECQKSTINVREGKHCILNAMGASVSAADYFLCLHADKASNEVSQPKLYEVVQISQKLYEDERKKAASDDDFFILFTTQNCNIQLPKNSGIVDKQNWEHYFGPFAGRSFIFAVQGPPDANSATRAQLQLTEGIGKAFGNRIIEERSKRPFSSVEQLQARCQIPLHVAKKLCVKKTPESNK